MGCRPWEVHLWLKTAKSERRSVADGAAAPVGCEFSTTAEWSEANFCQWDWNIQG